MDRMAANPKRNIIVVLCLAIGERQCFERVRNPAINRYIEEHNNEPEPFVWTKDANAILNRVARLNQALE